LFYDIKQVLWYVTDFVTIMIVKEVCYSVFFIDI